MNPCSKIGSMHRRCRSRMLPPAVWWPLVAAFVALWGRPARAEDATVSANLVEAVVDAGQPAEYHIDVTDGHTDEAPPAPTVDGLTITYASESQSRQYSFDGTVHSSTTYTYVYSIETTQPGRFISPGQDVRVGHETLAVPPVTLNVMGGGGGAAGGKDAAGTPARQSYFAELVIPKKSAYVGENTPAEVRVYFGWDVQAKVDPVPILNGDGFSVQKFTPPQTSVAERAGEQFRVVTYKTALAGVKTGAISVGPAEVTPVVRVPRTSTRRHSAFSDPFEDPFFNDPLSGLRQGPPKQVTLDSDPVTIEIKPLPPGRPDDFSGAIGQFKLEASADPRKAATGDPVTMRVILRGQGNFDRIEPPVLTDDSGLVTYPPTAKFKADDEVGLSGMKTFEQVLIANNARSSLPGYRFTYFDPATGRYQTLETPPVPVSITGAAILAPTPAEAAAGTPSPTPRPSPSPARAAGDILYIRTDFGRLRNAGAFLPLYRRPGFWEVQGAAALVILGLGASARWNRRRRDEVIRRAAELQRQRATLNRTLREENTGRFAFYSAARRLAELKAAAASGQPEAHLSPAEICQTRRLPPDVAGSLEEIFHRHEELAYSGRDQVQEPVPLEERRAVLATLESLGKN
jgi:hypothetical protein